MALSETQKQKIEEEEKYRAQIRGNLVSERYPKNAKNKFLAAALAIVLGSVGIHKFYLGRVGWGVTYILFSWTGIPMVLGIIEGIVYLCMSENSFDAKYS